MLADDTVARSVGPPVSDPVAEVQGQIAIEIFVVTSIHVLTVWRYTYYSLYLQDLQCCKSPPVSRGHRLSQCIKYRAEIWNALVWR